MPNSPVHVSDYCCRSEIWTVLRGSGLIHCLLMHVSTSVEACVCRHGTSCPLCCATECLFTALCFLRGAVVSNPGPTIPACYDHVALSSFQV